MRFASYMKAPAKLLSLPRSVKLISLIAFIYYIGWGVSISFYYIYLKEVLGSYTAVGLIESFTPLIAILIAFPLGILLNNMDKRKFISFILVLYIPFSFIFLSIQSILAFIFFKVYHGFISTALWLGAEVYVRQHSPKKKSSEAYGLLDVSIKMALIVGGIFAALFINYLGYSIFYSISIFAFIALIVSLFLPDHSKKKVAIPLMSIRLSSLKDNIKYFFKQKDLVKYSIFPFTTNLIFTFTAMALPLFFVSENVEFYKIAIFAALFSVPSLVEAHFSFYADIYRRKVFFIGLAVSTLLFLFSFFSSFIPLTFILLLALSISFAMIVPAQEGELTDLMRNKKVGSLTGILFSIKSLGAFIGPLLAGIISDLFGIKYVFLLGFVLCAILSILYIFKK